MTKDHAGTFSFYTYETKPIQPTNLSFVDFFQEDNEKGKILLFRKGETVTCTFNEHVMVKCGMIQNDYFEGNGAIRIMV